jgi:hypothetical protein
MGGFDVGDGGKLDWPDSGTGTALLVNFHGRFIYADFSKNRVAIRKGWPLCLLYGRAMPLTTV